MTFNQFDIVKVPFPFSDKEIVKKRPALIISTIRYQKLHSHYIMCMVTSAKNSTWHDDIKITNYKEAGLPSPSIIRFKLFTIDERLILGKIGNLNNADKEKVLTNLKTYLIENSFPIFYHFGIYKCSHFIS